MRMYLLVHLYQYLYITRYVQECPYVKLHIRKYTGPNSSAPVPSASPFQAGTP